MSMFQLEVLHSFGKLGLSLKSIKLSFSSVPPTSLSCGNVALTDLYQQTHPSMGLQFAFVLFNRPSAEPGWGICVYTSFCSSAVLMRNWCCCGPDGPFSSSFFLHSTNVPVDDNNMGLRLRDNTVWSGSAADGCACGRYKQRECQNNPQTSKESRSKGEKVGKKYASETSAKGRQKLKTDIAENT